jgi:hypothetical protein
VTVLRSYISVSYTEKYGDLRRKKHSFTGFVYADRIRSPFFSVYDRVAPYTVREKYGPCTIVYECIRTRICRPGYLCESNGFISYYHLYSQNEIIMEIYKLVQNGQIKRVTSNDCVTRYVLSDTIHNSEFSF